MSLYGPDGAGCDAASWPVATLDFEASSLSRVSYPIEVGIAIWRSPEGPVETWSTLIRPTVDWLEAGDWNPRSEQVHRIRQIELAAGMPARDVAERLIDLLDGVEAACDGLSKDEMWWRRLFEETPRTRGIRLVSHEGLLRRGGTRTRTFLETTQCEHRAGADAMRLMDGFALGVGLAPDVVRLRADGTPEPLRDGDRGAWAGSQAAHLRAGRLTDVDLDGLARELEAIASREAERKRELDALRPFLERMVAETDRVTLYERDVPADGGAGPASDT